MQLFEIIGNIGKDAEYKQNQQGGEFITFSVAVTKAMKNRDTGEVNKKTIWVECSRNGRQNVDQYLKAGVKVFCRGEAKARAYKNQQGDAIGSLGMRVMEIELLGKPSEKLDETPF